VIRSIIALSIFASACGDATLPPSQPQAPPKLAFDPRAKLDIASEDVAFDNGNVPGTIVRPTALGKYPGIILMAGSGPTDRNWNSPLIAGTNGSGKLLAESLASHGAVVLRFDKAKVGGNKEPVTAATTIDIYRDEGRAALALLRERHDVDAALLFVAGNSEGAYHTIRVAEAEGHAIAGILLLSGAGISLAQELVAQVDAQLEKAMPAMKDATHTALQQAFADIIAGKPVDPAVVSKIPGIQMLLRSLTAPDAAGLARTLLAFDPITELPKVEVPVFVYAGEKDVQVDPDVNAKALAAASSHSTLFLAPDANHILEHEARAKADIGTDIKYNEPDRVLDPASADAIAQWIALTISKR
jgi:hypothetical protein